MSYEYGRKTHAAINTDSLSVIDCKITTVSVYDKNTVFGIIDSVTKYNYIFMILLYNSSVIYTIILLRKHIVFQ